MNEETKIRTYIRDVTFLKYLIVVLGGVSVSWRMEFRLLSMNRLFNSSPDQIENIFSISPIG